jgi:hypothetical protein
MSALFDSKTDRTVRLLTEADLTRCQQLLDEGKGLTCVEGWLMLRDIRLLRMELAALKAKVSR